VEISLACRERDQRLMGNTGDCGNYKGFCPIIFGINIVRLLYLLFNHKGKKQKFNKTSKVILLIRSQQPQPI
jgi:hypothetical protein